MPNEKNHETGQDTTGQAGANDDSRKVDTGDDSGAATSSADQADGHGGDKDKALHSERAKRKAERDARIAAEARVEELTRELSEAQTHPSDETKLSKSALDELGDDDLADPERVREAIKKDMGKVSEQIRQQLDVYGAREKNTREIRQLISRHEIFSDPEYGDIARDMLKARVSAAGKDGNFEELVQTVAKRVSEVAVARENARSDRDEFEPPPPAGSPGAEAFSEYHGGNKPKNIGELKQIARAAAAKMGRRFKRG